MKIAEALSPSPSDPEKVYVPPAVSAGIGKVQLNVPEESERFEQAVPPAQVTVTRAPAANPVPCSVTLVPGGPPDGVAESPVLNDVTTEKEAVAVSAEASVALNVCGPAVAGGMTTEQPKLPEGFVTAVQTVPPLHPTATAELAAKPVPAKVMFVSTGPLVGLSTSPGTMENVVSATWLEPSLAVTSRAPAGDAGTVPAHEKLPKVPLTPVQIVDDPPDTVTVAFEANPVPLTARGAPTVPLEMLSETLASTENSALAESGGFAESLPVKVWTPAALATRT